jgi:hypothetical protein
MRLQDRFNAYLTVTMSRLQEEKKMILTKIRELFAQQPPQ